MLAAAATADGVGADSAGQGGEGGGVARGAPTAVSDGGGVAAAPDQAAGVEEPRRDSVVNEVMGIGHGAAALSAAEHAEQAQPAPAAAADGAESGAQGTSVEAQAEDGSMHLANGGADGLSSPAGSQQAAGAQGMQHEEAGASQQQPEQAMVTSAGQGPAASSRPFTAQDEVSKSHTRSPCAKSSPARGHQGLLIPGNACYVICTGSTTMGRRPEQAQAALRRRGLTACCARSRARTPSTTSR